MTTTDKAQNLASTEPAVAVQYEAAKAPEQIEEDIVRTREQVGDTIDALEHKLSPRRFVAQTTDRLLDGIEQDLASAAAQLRQNAIPLGLIAAGFAWLLLAQKRETRQDIGAMTSDGSTEAFPTGASPEAFPPPSETTEMVITSTDDVIGVAETVTVDELTRETPIGRAVDDAAVGADIPAGASGTESPAGLEVGEDVTADPIPLTEADLAVAADKPPKDETDRPPGTGA